MKLEFDPEEDRAFPASRQEILDAFSAWFVNHDYCTQDHAKEVAGDVGLALEWKWAYQDGNLAWWNVSHIIDYLLEWCPRKLSVDPKHCDDIREALGHWFRFLDARNLLSSDGHSVEILLDAVEVLRDDFIAAMGDRSKFGMAKSLFSLGTDAGVDMSDPEQVSAHIERYNDLTIDERKDLLSDHLFANAGPSTPDRRLAPVIMPTDDEISRSLTSIPILPKFRDLVIFLGKGRPLTKKGHLTLADARVLVDLLSTGDEMDPRYGDLTFRTTSSDNLRGLRLIVAWAKKAGLVRVLRGKLVPTKRGIGLQDELTREFEHVVDGLFAAGPLAIQSRSNQWRILSAIWTSLDDMSIDLLTVPYVMMEHVPIDMLTDVATTEVLEAWQFAVDDDTIQSYVSSAINKMIDAFELCGLVTRESTHMSIGETSPEGGSVTLTPVGVVTVRRLLIAAGFEVPLAGRFAALSAAGLLEALNDEDEEIVRTEVLAWCKVREPSDAVDEFARAITELDDPALQIQALELLSEINVDLAAPHVLELTAQPDVAGFALCWLADNNLIGEQDLWIRATPFVFVDVLVHRMIALGPEGLLTTLALVGTDEQQCALFDTIWRAPSPGTALVLAGIDKAHPSKLVKKAARKALFKMRSSLPAT